MDIAAVLQHKQQHLRAVPMFEDAILAPTTAEQARRLEEALDSVERRHGAQQAAALREYTCNPYYPPNDRDPAITSAIVVAGHIGRIAQALYDMYRHGQEPDDFGQEAGHQPHAEAIVSAMAGTGWGLAGSGFFSLVFTKGSLAIKVGLKAEDSGAAYAAWARDNAGLPGVPTIHDIQRHGRQSYTVVMPMYVPLPSNCEPTMDLIRNEGLGDTMDAIEAFFQGVAQIDIHDENVMRDLDDNLIITDPVSYKRGA